MGLNEILERDTDGGIGRHVIVVDAGGGDKIADVPFGEVETDDIGHDGGDFGGITVLVHDGFVVEDGGVGRFDVFGSVQQLLQTGHTQCDVLV
jgi:hypothetical protein